MIFYVLAAGAIAWGLIALSGCAETKHQLGIDKCTQPTQEEAVLTQKVWKDGKKKWN